MNTAGNVVLTIAVGAGGIGAYASGSDGKPPPTEPVAQPRTVEVLVAKSKPGQSGTLARAGRTGMLSVALRSIVDLDAVETRFNDQVPRRSGGINMARYGTSNPMTS